MRITSFFYRSFFFSFLGSLCNFIDQWFSTELPPVGYSPRVPQVYYLELGTCKLVSLSKCTGIRRVSGMFH